MTDFYLESLRKEQARLRLQVENLGQRIEDLEKSRSESPQAISPVPPPLEPEPVSLPPTVPPPALPKLEPAPLPQAAPAAATHRNSLELEVGQIWLVRIGIGMLLTGLIFLASFTYQHFIDYVTPFERAAALFVVSLGLAGLGLWLEGRETLRYYGRVLAAGGLAGGYYALYASHYVPALQWIDGALASNLALMGWAAVIIGVACWRRAQTLGVAAIVLAYYTSILGPDVSYTLGSNLILAGSAVFLTLRYGWKFVSYAALLGTYGTYAVSRLVHWAPAASPDAGVVTGYWVIFALAVLWPRVGSWERNERISLLTLNNACYLPLGAFALSGDFDKTFPDFAMIFGAGLIATAFLSRRLRPDDAAQETAFFVQGILAFTLGWLSRWHGPSGALILGAESALLLSASVWRHGRTLRALAYLVAAVAFFWGSYGCLDETAWRGEWVPLLLAALFAAQALGLGLFRQTETELPWGVAYFSTFSGLLYLIWIEKQVPEQHQFWVLMASGAVLYAFQFLKLSRFFNWIPMIFWGLAAVAFAFVYDSAERIFWANGLALAGAFLLEQAAIKRIPSAFLSRQGQILWLSLVFLGAWAYCAEVAGVFHPDWSLTLIWAVTAGGLFALGLASRERIARWWGLIILGAALGRVLIVDVWQLETLSRIFTFLGLGAILLVLGFVYNRYQETIKKWL